MLLLQAAADELAKLEDRRGGDHEIILYCRSGVRFGRAASALAKEGFRNANAGGFGDWVNARLSGGQAAGRCALINLACGRKAGIPASASLDFR